METISEIRETLKYAPKHSGPIANNLSGWWLPSGFYLCATCAGRIIGRGVHIQGESVWSDRADPFGVCAGCEGEEK